MDAKHLLDDARAPAEIDTATPTDVATLTHRMRELKQHLDHLEDERKETQAEYDEIRKRTLPDALGAAGLTGFKTRDGLAIHLRREVFASVTKENVPRFHQWLRDNGHGSLITPQVHAATLKAFAREQLEHGIELPDCIKIYEEPVAVLSQAKPAS